MKRSTLYETTSILLLALLLTSACSSSNSTASAPFPPNKGPAPTIVLDNTSPENIDLDITAGVTQSIPPMQPHFEIATAFYYQHIKIIQFKQGEKFVCNGNNMPTNSSSGYISLKLPAPGTVISCDYISPQGRASFSFTIPDQVKILSPTSGATVTRSSNTPLDIQFAPECKGFAIDTGYASTQGGYYEGTQNSSNVCSAHQTINTLGMPAGRGMIGVSDIDNINPVTNNAGFHSLTFYVFTDTQVAITWK